MITNISVTKIESKIYPSNLSPKCNVALNINLRDPDIIFQKTSFGNKNFLVTKYLLSVNYLEPSMGYIIVEGDIFYYLEHPKLLEIKENWNTAVSNEVKNEIANTLLLSNMPFIIDISQKLKLPLPIALPQINFNTPTHTNNTIEGYN